MAVYKPKKKTGTNTFEEIKIPASCIDGLPSGGGGKTYTFAEGTTNGAFQVTPSGGTAQSVKVHGLGMAAYHDVNLEISSSSQNLPTSAAVFTYVENSLSSKVDINGDQNIYGKKNFSTLQVGGGNVAVQKLYYKLASPKIVTSTTSGSGSIQLSSFVTNFDSSKRYEIFGQIFAYHTTTAKVYLWSDLWGSTNSTSYYIINTTSNSRCGSLAFTIPCKSYLYFNKNIAISEFSLIIYGYREMY